MSIYPMPEFRSDIFLLERVLQNPRTEVWELVGARGFEPRTPCAQGRCATRLRYAPTFLTTSRPINEQFNYKRRNAL